MRDLLAAYGKALKQQGWGDAISLSRRTNYLST